MKLKKLTLGLQNLGKRFKVYSRTKNPTDKAIIEKH